MMLGKNKTAPEKVTSGAETENIYNKNIAQTAKKIKCVIQKPGQMSEIAEIDNTLEAFRAVIGGCANGMWLSSLATSILYVFVNRENTYSKNIYESSIKPNIRMNGKRIVGTVIITAIDRSFRPCSMTNQEIQYAREWLLRNSI